MSEMIIYNQKVAAIKPDTWNTEQKSFKIVIDDHNKTLLHIFWFPKNDTDFLIFF